MDNYTPNREPYSGIGPLENRDKEIPDPIANDTWTVTDGGSVTSITIHDGSVWNTF